MTMGAAIPTRPPRPPRGERRERLLDDLDLKLDVAVNAINFAERPIEDVVAEIRHALGLAPMAAANDDEDPDDEDLGDEDLGDEDRDDDEPGGGAERGAEPPGLEPDWETAPSRPRRGSG